MPKPMKGESANKYVHRAMPMIHEEHPELNQKQMLGRAFGMYRNSKKKGRRKTLHENAIMK